MATSVSPGEPRLTGTPWSIRPGRARHGRTALEIYDGESLIDIVVATPIAPELLRGTCRGVRSGRRGVVAWTPWRRWT